MILKYYHSISYCPSQHLAVLPSHLLAVWEDSEWSQKPAKSLAKLALCGFCVEPQNKASLPCRVVLGYLSATLLCYGEFLHHYFVFSCFASAILEKIKAL